MDKETFIINNNTFWSRCCAGRWFVPFFTFVFQFIVESLIFKGTTLRQFKFSDETIMLISYPGELFLRILKLLTLPLLISSLINVSANLNARMSGKIAMRTIVYFVITTVITALMGMCIALIFKPGDLGTSTDVSETETKPNSKLLDSVLDLGRYGIHTK